MATITIKIPDTPRERDEVLSFLKERGLIDTSSPPPDSEKVTGEPSKWSVFADKIHRESPLDGQSEMLIKSVGEFRKNFAFRK